MGTSRRKRVFSATQARREGVAEIAADLRSQKRRARLKMTLIFRSSSQDIYLYVRSKASGILPRVFFVEIARPTPPHLPRSPARLHLFSQGSTSMLKPACTRSRRRGPSSATERWPPAGTVPRQPLAWRRWWRRQVRRTRHPDTEGTRDEGFLLGSGTQPIAAVSPSTQPTGVRAAEAETAGARVTRVAPPARRQEAEAGLEGRLAGGTRSHRNTARLLSARLRRCGNPRAAVGETAAVHPGGGGGTRDAGKEKESRRTGG